VHNDHRFYGNRSFCYCQLGQYAKWVAQHHGFLTFEVGTVPNVNVCSLLGCGSVKLVIRDLKESTDNVVMPYVETDVVKC
jgi:hypothetical protein